VAKKIGDGAQIALARDRVAEQDRELAAVLEGEGLGDDEAALACGALFPNSLTAQQPNGLAHRQWLRVSRHA